MVKPGWYLHYKGHQVRVIGEGKHTESEEELVIYEHPDLRTGKVKLWARPKKMFMERIKLNGEIVPRFKYLGKIK